MGIDLSLRHCTLYNQICYAAMYTPYIFIYKMFIMRKYTPAVCTAVVSRQLCRMWGQLGIGRLGARERDQLIVITHHSNQKVAMVTFCQWFWMLKWCWYSDDDTYCHGLCIGAVYSWAVWPPQQCALGCAVWGPLQSLQPLPSQQQQQHNIISTVNVDTEQTVQIQNIEMGRKSHFLYGCPPLTEFHETQ